MKRRQHPIGGRRPAPIRGWSAILASSLVLCCWSLLQHPVLGQPGCPCDTPSSPPPPEIYPPPAEVYPPPSPPPAEVYPSPPPPHKHSPPKADYPPPPPSQLPATGAGCCVIVPQGPLYVVDPSWSSSSSLRDLNAKGAAHASWVVSLAIRMGLVPVLGSLWLLLL